VPKVIVPCKTCGKEMKLPTSSVKGTGNYCRKCIGKSPERIALLKRNNENPEIREAARLRMIELNKDNPLNPRWVAGHKSGIVKREANPDNIKARKDGYKIRSANPEWKENLKKAAVIRNQSTDFVQVKTEQNRVLAKDPEWKRNLNEGINNRSTNQTWLQRITEANQERAKDPEWRKKISATKQGCSIEEWKGFTHFGPYCEKFNEPTKKKKRAVFSGCCCLTGVTKEENSNNAMSVHHVFVEKKACCESLIEEMDVIRKRLPSGIARFGEPQFSEEEIKYIRMMVPLCISAHSKMQKERDVPYEETVYRKYFVELLLNLERCGKDHYTKEEIQSICRSKNNG
jgi:hypothetical protein